MGPTPRTSKRARPGASPRRHAPDSPVRRQQLLEAAVSVFLKKGFHAARIEDICEKAGTGKGTFYLRFKSKEEALLAALDDFFGELNETMTWVAESIGEQSEIQEVFHQEAKRLFVTMIKHREIAMIILREGRSAGPRIERKISAFYRQLIRRSAENIGVAVRFGLLPEQDPEIAAVCVVGAVEKIYLLWLQGELKGEEDRLLREALGFLFRGVGLNPGRAE